MPAYNKKLKVIDLFSGLGGFSQAFLDRGHDVTRYDFNPVFENIPNTIIKDVLELISDELKGSDIILASIDCTHFTHANSNPDKEGLDLSVRLAKHTLNIIREANPRFWIIENPPGRIKKVLGPPVYKTAWGYWGTPYFKPTWLWGKLPFMKWPRKYKEPLPKESWNLETFKTHKFAYLCPSDSKLRSLVPYEFSKVVCIATEKATHTQEVLI